MSCVVLAACPASRARARAAALLALALLLGAGVASTAAAAAQENVTSCSLLAAKCAESVVGEQRSVWQKGVASNVTLVWGSEPARAAAALLRVLLQHVRLFSGVRVQHERTPLATAALATTVPFSPVGAYTDLLIGVSTAWEPAPHTWEPKRGPLPGLAGPRLAEFGASPVPARRRLFACLAPRVRSACRGHERWAFYSNPTALADCDFLNPGSTQASTVDVLSVGDCSECNATLQRLVERANATHTRLNKRIVDRAQLLRDLDTTNRSFLFLDWDIWKGAANVSVVEPPPCVSVDFDCKQELDSTVAMRVADVDILQTYAPHLFQYVHDFKPSLESLRLILGRQASGVDIEEAACERALEENSWNIEQNDKKKYDIHKYTVIIYLCYGDDYINSQYEKILGLLGKLIYNTFQEKNSRCDLKLNRRYTLCDQDNDMSDRLNKYAQTTDLYSLVGVVSMSVKGVAGASASAAAANVPLMLADVVPEQGSGGPRAAATWRAAGRPRHIARALLRLVRLARWTRLAVLSQHTELAADYYATLKDQDEIKLREFSIPLSVGEQEAQAVLQDLRDTNARIVFINADSQAAATIVSAAAAAGMGYSNGFVWIVREWRQSNMVCETKHFMVSFWSRGLKGLPLEDSWQPVRDKLKNISQPWPPRALSIVDALLSLSMGFHDVFQRNPEIRQDLRSAQMIRLLKESLMEKPVASVSQRLHYTERSIEETHVFVDQWCGGGFNLRLATWRVNATSGDVLGNLTWPDQLPPDDGRSGCTVQTGDPFDPRCHDAECAGAVVLLALSPGAVLLARRALRRRIARLLQEQQIQVIARRRHVATVLAAYLVEREALELREELGAGRFGSVCLARLRVPGRTARYIAAKALRDNAAPAEESEFLREACTIASLEHAHIVRLVGVCIADGPPLVLMELAFFGDLLGYLRERRHLVEGTGSEEPAESGEAEHVSAEALTRLAREAAEALQYLSARGVVHRDVRAANCLVDVRRSLKLADFGMARDTVAGADGAPEYACRRRGLFPVLWMAPESLAHGVFSAASDVWALGVLMLELVTLGVRPYGSMSPLRVLEYVAAGGSPPLPLDATPQTRGMARLCWARAAERRPSAAELATYLAAWPRALSPALLPQCDEPADADSGFGESPSTELLPPDSPLHSLCQLDDLAATH